MSTESARKKLNGHGRVICRECKKTIISCKCPMCTKTTHYDVCDDCEGKERK